MSLGLYGACDPRLNAVASLKLEVVDAGLVSAECDPRLNAVASLKLENPALYLHATLL